MTGKNGHRPFWKMHRQIKHLKVALHIKSSASLISKPSINSNRVKEILINNE